MKINEPISYEECMKLDSDTRQGWKIAMDDEMNSLKKHNTWELVPLPTGRKAITNKWVFKEKLNSDGERDKLKARLVVRGFTQQKDIDYDETFAPVLHFNTFRTILSIATEKNLFMTQMDVSTAFLNGELNEEIYMTQPEGYIDNTHPEYVCKLKKSLYGLKQAPRMWNKRINDFLLKCGFTRSVSDPCLYFKTKGNDIHLIGLFVDDLLQASNKKELLEETRKLLESEFKMTYQGAPSQCLGIEIERDSEKGETKLLLSRYTKDLLTRFGMEKCNSAQTPQEINGKIIKARKEDPVIDGENYRQLVGSLIYLASRTRPDISCAVRAVSEHLGHPTNASWLAAKRILRYLAGTVNYGLLYSRSADGTDIHGISDADWGGCVNTRRSTTGNLVYMGKNLIMWKSTKQHTVALSSTEAEYLGITDTMKDLLWLKNLLVEIQYITEDQSLRLLGDNAGSLDLARNQVTLSRSKHIDIRHHFIRQHVENGDVKIVHIPGKENIADVLTKGLGKIAFNRCLASLGMERFQSESGCERVHVTGTAECSSR